MQNKYDQNSLLKEKKLCKNFKKSIFQNAIKCLFFVVFTLESTFECWDSVWNTFNRKNNIDIILRGCSYLLVKIAKKRQFQNLEEEIL